MKSIASLQQDIIDIPIEKIRALCSDKDTADMVFSLVISFGTDVLSIFLDPNPTDMILLRSDWEFEDKEILRLIAQYGSTSNDVWNEYFTGHYFDHVIKEMCNTIPFHRLLSHEKEYFLHHIFHSFSLPKGEHTIVGGPSHISYSLETLSRKVFFQYDLDVCSVHTVSGLFDYVFAQESTRPTTAAHYVEKIDSLLFCNALSIKMNRKPVYEITKETINYDMHADGYRLLTEAEWEAIFLYNREPQLHCTFAPTYSNRMLCEKEWVFDMFQSYYYLFDGNDPVCEESTAFFSVQRFIKQPYVRYIGDHPAVFRICCHAKRR